MLNGLYLGSDQHALASCVVAPEYGTSARRQLWNKQQSLPSGVDIYSSPHLREHALGATDVVTVCDTYM